MPERDSIANTAPQSTTLRRSPRFLHRKSTPETEQPTATLPKCQRLVHQKKSAAEPENPRTPKSKPRSNPVRSLNPSVSSEKSTKAKDGSIKSPRLKGGDEPETEQPTATLPKCQRFVHQKKRAAEPENPRTPKSKPRSNPVRSLNPSVSSKKSTKAKDGSIKSPRLKDGDEQLCSLRRSSRVLNRQVVVIDQRKGEFDNRSSNHAKLSSESSKSVRLNDVKEGFQSPRRSLRLYEKQNVVVEHTDTAANAKSNSLTYSSFDEEELSSFGKAGACVNSCESIRSKSKRVGSRSSVGVETVILEGREKKAKFFDGGDKEFGVGRKRKRDEDGLRVVQGWTKEQELALQRAYLAAKPTPHFWKKVSKLVPGKSAQDCFDKVHSDHMTPPQPRLRSRAKRLTNSSPLEQFSLSASKLLKPTEPKVKKPSCNKQRSHLAQKTVRKLLQKHYQVYQDYEADLFSVFEPSLGPSTDNQPSTILSTPKNLQEKQGPLQNCSQKSSSGHKMPLSRFSSSSGTPLVSPPVLKQVKNRALHEKYIDQLHNREAKRKAATKCAKKSTVGTEHRKKSHIQEVDVVRTAKIALVSDARDAISKLPHLVANAMDNSSDIDDDDGIVSDDEEDEDDT